MDFPPVNEALSGHPVAGLPGRVPGPKDLCSLGSEDST